MTKVAIITGGGSGIGRATAVAFFRAGYRVAVAGRREQELIHTGELAGADGRSFLAIPTDVSDPEAVARLFEETRRTFGRLDVLFNNAGCSAPGVPLEDLKIEKWNQVVATNLTGAFLCAQQAIRIMKAQDPRGGRIINNGSLAAHSPRPNSAPYTATKHALTGLTKSIALDGRKHDITCSQIDIGNAATPMTARMAAGVPQADGRIAPEPVFDVELAADAIVRMAELPPEANVLFLTLMASKMPLVGRG